MGFGCGVRKGRPNQRPAGAGMARTCPLESRRESTPGLAAWSAGMVTRYCRAMLENDSLATTRCVRACGVGVEGDTGVRAEGANPVGLG